MRHFHDESRGRDENHWSNGFKPSELIGLDVAGFYSAVRGRFASPSCAKPAASIAPAAAARRAPSGDCGFTPDAGFMQLLASRGIGRPIARAGVWPDGARCASRADRCGRGCALSDPAVDDLMSMTAIGVTGNYIGDLARAGYRPEFDPFRWSSSRRSRSRRSGSAASPASVTRTFRRRPHAVEGARYRRADFITGFDRLGYRRLPVDDLVQLKALNITPEFARSAVGQGRPLPSVDELVQIKMFGRGR